MLTKSPASGVLLRQQKTTFDTVSTCLLNVEGAKVT